MMATNPAMRYGDEMLPHARVATHPAPHHNVATVEPRISAAVLATPVPNSVVSNVGLSMDANNTAGGGSNSAKNIGVGQQTQSKAPIKRPARRGIKQPPDRAPRALFLFTLKNPIRKICINVVEWKYPFMYFTITTGSSENRESPF